MSEPLKLHYDVSGGDFTSAGKASVQAKKALRQLGFDPDVIRRVAIAMYEGEINMVIHANGGSADLVVNPDSVDIILADTGPGIPAELHDKVFERFFRVDKSRSKSTGGTGLGLAIVKHIVAQHEAQISLESEEGAGTEIKVTFLK